MRRGTFPTAAAHPLLGRRSGWANWRAKRKASDLGRVTEPITGRVAPSVLSPNQKGAKAFRAMSEQSFPLAPSERSNPDDVIHPLSGKKFRALIACEAILGHLANEVLASLPLMEPLARREFGNTNYNILIATAERAREALKQSEAAFKTEG